MATAEHHHPFPLSAEALAKVENHSILSAINPYWEQSLFKKTKMSSPDSIYFTWFSAQQDLQDQSYKTHPAGWWEYYVLPPIFEKSRWYGQHFCRWRRGISFSANWIEIKIVNVDWGDWSACITNFPITAHYQNLPRNALNILLAICKPLKKLRLRARAW